MTPEFSFVVRAHDIGAPRRSHRIAASADERLALAKRFDLLALDRLDAELTTQRDSRGIMVAGRVRAAGAQACAISAEAVPFALDEAVELRFSDTAAAAVEDVEIELSEPDLETLPLDGDTLDLGEVAAQSLGLGLDPYPRAPAAVRAAAEQFLIDEEAARAAGNPFSVLKR